MAEQYSKKYETAMNRWKHFESIGMKKTAIVSCYFQHNYGSMLQVHMPRKMALDKLIME